MLCRHCQRPLLAPEYTLHAEGRYRGKHRCDPEDSRLPYGYNAHPPGQPCDPTCLGYPPEQAPRGAVVWAKAIGTQVEHRIDLAGRMYLIRSTFENEGNPTMRLLLEDLGAVSPG